MVTPPNETDFVMQLRTRKVDKILISEAIIPYEAIRTSNISEIIVLSAFDMIAEKHGKELKGKG